MLKLKEIYFNENNSSITEGRKFIDINKFKRIKKHLDQKNYLNFATELGSGTSRIVYPISSSKVLKFAKNTFGVQQNKKEVEVFTNPKTKNITTKIYDYDPNYYWIISELVRPLNSTKEFKLLTGISYNDYELIMSEMMRYNFINTDHLRNIYKIPKINMFIDSIKTFIKENNLAFNDIIHFDHYGKTNDNRIVVLDYGYENYSI